MAIKAEDLPKGRDFYDGKGFDNLTGPGARAAYALHEHMAKVREGESLKGNLYEPRVSADFPGAACNLPINLPVWPERGMDFVLLRGEPGSAWPEHAHGYGDEIYVIIGGRGFVTIDGVEHEAKLHDIFYLPQGTPHSYRVPEDAETTFDILAVNAPGVPHDKRSTFWAAKPPRKTQGRGA